MNYLISHSWQLYFISLALTVIAYAVIGMPEFKVWSVFPAVFYAAIPELIAVYGIRFYQKGHMIPASIIAILSCLAVAAAVWVFWADSHSHAYDYLPSKAAGICAGILCIISVVLCCISFSGTIPQIIIVSCCLCGMVSVAYICGYLTAFADGMGGP